MIWYLFIPAIVFLTFKNLIASGFPDLEGQHPTTFLGWIFLIFVGLAISGIISLAPFGISCWIGSIPEVIGRPNPEFPLIALREKDGISGKFYFLGAGSINSTEYYFWYRKNSDGSISGGKTARQSGVRIWEDDDHPHMVTFHTEYANPLARKLLWIVGTDMRDDEQWCPDFYIPKGSIKEGFLL